MISERISSESENNKKLKGDLDVIKETEADSVHNKTSNNEEVKNDA